MIVLSSMGGRVRGGVKLEFRQEISGIVGPGRGLLTGDRGGHDFRPDKTRIVGPDQGAQRILGRTLPPL